MSILNIMFQKYDSYKGKGFAELELRFDPITDFEFFERIIREYLKGHKFESCLQLSSTVHVNNAFEKSIGLTDTGKISNYRIELPYRKPRIYCIKTRLMPPKKVTNEFIPYKITLNEEIISPKFNAKLNSMVRHRFRLSIPLNNLWKVELTGIKVDEFDASLPHKITSLFGDIDNLDSFLAKIRDQCDSYEIEFEAISSKISQIDVTEVVNTYFLLIDPNFKTNIDYQNHLVNIATAMGHNRPELFKNPKMKLKSLANQVIALNKKNYAEQVLANISDYYITDKADGTRVIVTLKSGTMTVVLSDSLEEFHAKKEESGNNAFVAIDAELIGNNLYLFDIFSDLPFSKRLEQLDNYVADLNKIGSKYKIIAKKYIKINSNDDLEKSIRNVYYAKYDYKLDGLIFTQDGQPYIKTMNYKWKPFEDNTIDFYAIKCPTMFMGSNPYIQQKGYTIYLLFSGIDHKIREQMGLSLMYRYNQIVGIRRDNTYYPVQFSPSMNPYAYIYFHPDGKPDLDKKIVELSRDSTNENWIFHRIREDRSSEHNYYGNNFAIAEDIYMNYVDPFLLEDLWSPSVGYFASNASDEYVASNGYKRFVISNLLQTYTKNAEYVIDLASGRGADISRYMDNNVKHLLCIERDREALTELVRRKYTISRSKLKIGGENEKKFLSTLITAKDYRKLMPDNTNNTIIHTMCADLREPSGDILKNIDYYGCESANAVVCNFALHYFCDNEKNLRNILQIASTILKNKGFFIFTVLNGEFVFSKLKQKKIWEVTEDGKQKYAIIKQFQQPTIAKYGQNIDVKLPFAAEMYSEPLCNISNIIKLGQEYGLKSMVLSSMGSMMNQFAVSNPSMYNRLTDGDKQYVDLHSYCVMQKKA